ncbi:hypothetical protein ANCDUO_17718 [Ancylostoma duodenale]|uniref:Uncharacterized protein n=1 Tax=Ancylostoma duodenale TaxID=51022 RepID=A0A0C2G544_9BILA|nr:hypothetical protein ANCDUO_17718 [Ancylostoma duodenale]
MCNVWSSTQHIAMPQSGPPRGSGLQTPPILRPLSSVYSSRHLPELFHHLRHYTAQSTTPVAFRHTTFFDVTFMCLCVFFFYHVGSSLARPKVFCPSGQNQKL